MQVRPTRNISLLFGLITCVFCRSGEASALFPDLPKRVLPPIQQLPTSGAAILDVRTDVLSGDPVVLPEYTTEIELGVYNLETRSESKWTLGDGIQLRVESRCQVCVMRSSWASKTRQLFLALKDRAYLINADGRFAALNLKMPGTSLPYSEADMFSISEDGQQIAFRIFARDPGEKVSVDNDPYAYKLGRLHQDLLYEDMRGSVPITVAQAQAVTPSDWSPDGSKVAYGRGAIKGSNEAIAVVDLSGKLMASISPILSANQPGDKYIGNVRWKPDGKSLGFVLTRYWFEGSKQLGKSTLYTVDADGHNLKAVQFENKDINVMAFAWSPSGQQIAFRSDYEAKKLCNFNVVFYAQTGGQPCRDAEHLYVSNFDGTGLRRISKDPEYRHGQLFWIQ